jgi:hypothetical protein
VSSTHTRLTGDVGAQQANLEGRTRLSGQTELDLHTTSDRLKERDKKRNFVFDSLNTSLKGDTW